MNNRNQKNQANQSNMDITSVSESLIIHTIMNNSYDTIYFKNSDSKFILNSKAHATQMGESGAEKMYGKSDFDYFPAEFAQKSFEEEKNIMNTGVAKIAHVERWEKPDKTVIWLSASKYPLYDETGHIIGTWGTSRDITELKNAEIKLDILNRELQKVNETLEALSIHDALSGLYNHRHFYNALSLEESKIERYGEKETISGFSVILFDIDHFKFVNDTYGHLVGDYVIKQIGDLLNSNVRNVDLCFRYGGDEFALLINGNNHKATICLAEKIRVMIEQLPIVYNSLTVKVTVSIGVVCSGEADTVNKLMALADQRLYQSKESGRNKVT